MWVVCGILLVLAGHPIAAVNSPLTVEIMEESPVGTFVNGVSDYLAQLRAHLFLPDGAEVRYQLLGDDQFPKLFTLHPTLGHLRVAARIDRESICPNQVHMRSPHGANGPVSARGFNIPAINEADCVVTLNVLSITKAVSDQRSDSDSVRLGSTNRIRIYVIVRDINDNAPHWSAQHSSIHIGFVETPTTVFGLAPLSGQSLLTLEDTGSKFAKTIDRAIDPDLGLNGTVTYRLVGPGAELFRLDDTSSSAELTSFPGSFPSPTADLSTIESTAQTPLRIWPVVPLDRETDDFAGQGGLFNLTLIATDLGTPPRTGSTKLVISVIDVNDHAPVFHADHSNSRSERLDQTRAENQLVVYRPPNGSLRETLPVGSLVLQLNASDRDTGVHADLTYEFCPCDRNMAAWSFFKIDPRSGRVTVARRLDYDSGPRQFQFKVIAKDGAPEPYTLTGTALVEIALSDENDEAPEISVMLVDPVTPTDETTFSNGVAPTHSRFATSNPMGTKLLAEYNAVINENPKPDTVIAYIQVLDRDNHGQDQIHCHLGPTDNFTLRLDSAESRSRRLDDLDASPFDQVLINPTPNRLDYRLVTGSPQAGRHASVLDRELTPRQEITLTCTDSGGNSAYVVIHVLVRDVNDNAPEFINGGNFVFPIIENQELIGGKPVWLGRTLATDRDQQENAVIEYRLEDSDLWQHSNKPSSGGANGFGELSQLFELDTQTGDLFAKVSFDREAAPEDGIYRFRVYAIDKGQPSLTGVATVEVCVIDVNDWPPQFTRDVYTFSTPEDTRLQEVVGRVEAIDRDADSSGKIVYQLLGYSKPHSPLTARVRRDETNQMDRSGLPMIESTVNQAHGFSVGNQETGGPSNASFPNEKRSLWAQSHAMMIESIQPELNYFTVDRLTGNIRLLRRLDRESIAYFSLEILATDVAPFSTLPARYRNYAASVMNQTFPAYVTQRSLSATATVMIAVTDVNDNAPVFRRPNTSAVTVQLRLHETLGRQLLVAEAVDADEGDNARVSYSIRTEVPRPPAGPGTGHFSIDETSGILFLAKTLNTTGSHRLVIEACDNALGGKKLCTLSPAIRISVFDGSEIGDSGLDMVSFASRPGQPGQPELDLDILAARSAVAVQASRRNEVVVVCLVVIFAILLLATLFLVACLIHRRGGSGTTRWGSAGGRRSGQSADSAMHSQERAGLKAAHTGQAEHELWLEEALQQEQAKAMMESKIELNRASHYGTHGNSAGPKYLVKDSGGMFYTTTNPTLGYDPAGLSFSGNSHLSRGPSDSSHFSPSCRVAAYRGQPFSQLSSGFCDLTQSTYKCPTSDYQSLDVVWRHPFPPGSDLEPNRHRRRELPEQPIDRASPSTDLMMSEPFDSPQAYYELDEGGTFWPGAETERPSQPRVTDRQPLTRDRKTYNRIATMGRSTSGAGKRKRRLGSGEDASMHNGQAGDLAICSASKGSETGDEGLVGSCEDLVGVTSADDAKPKGSTYQSFPAYREGTFV